MQICRRLAGFTFGHADLVRRAMAKKKQAEMEREEQAFLAGCQENGVPAEKAQEIFDLIREFANYAFNKSHAAAYAVLAYRTAYLKAHYPQHYLCALLNSVSGWHGKLREYASDCASLHISILPPDVNRSDASFRAEGENIRYGLGAIKNVGELFAARIVSERNAGEYRSVEDFLSRVSAFASIRPLQSLIFAGALDRFGVGRGGMLERLESALDRLSGLRAHHTIGQISMFDEPGEEGLSLHLELPEEETLSLTDRLSGEKEHTGLYFSGHPMDKYAPLRERLGAETVRSLYERLEGSAQTAGIPCSLLGMITGKRIHKTKKREEMAFAAVEDETGELEMILFPTVYARVGNEIVPGEILLLKGEAELSDGVDADAPPILKMILKNISKPETISEPEGAILKRNEAASAPVHSPGALYLRVNAKNRHRMDEALSLARQTPGDARLLVYFAEEGKLRAVKGVQCDPQDALLQNLRSALGDENVAYKMSRDEGEKGQNL